MRRLLLMFNLMHCGISHRNTWLITCVSRFYLWLLGVIHSFSRKRRLCRLEEIWPMTNCIQIDNKYLLMRNMCLFHVITGQWDNVLRVWGMIYHRSLNPVISYRSLSSISERILWELYSNRLNPPPPNMSISCDGYSSHCLEMPNLQFCLANVTSGQSELIKDPHCNLWILRNICSKYYMLWLAECLWEFWNNAWGMVSYMPPSDDYMLEVTVILV